VIPQVNIQRLTPSIIWAGLSSWKTTYASSEMVHSLWPGMLTGWPFVLRCLWHLDLKVTGRAPRVAKVTRCAFKENNSEMKPGNNFLVL